MDGEAGNVVIALAWQLQSLSGCETVASSVHAVRNLGKTQFAVVCES